MTTTDRLSQVKRQVEQTKHRRILEENRVRESQRKTDDRRKYIIGTLFCKHFLGDPTWQFDRGRPPQF